MFSLEHLGLLGYWFTLLVACAEAIVFFGAFVPGTTIILTMGGLAAHGWYDAAALIFFAIPGAILGDTISYELGRRGEVFAQRLSRLQAPIAKGRKFVQRYGWLSIFLGRFASPLRGTTPFVAGVVGMERMPFYLANVVSSVLWACLFIGLGYLGGTTVQWAFHWTRRTKEILVALILLLSLAVWLWRRIRRDSVGSSCRTF